MKNVTKILCAIAFVIAVSCAKDGATGPAGNANVMYSDWFSPAAWTASGVNETFFFDKAEAKITQSILDSSLVLAFVQLVSDGSNVRPLPANTGTSTFWNFHLTVGNIRFTTNFNGGAPAIENKL